MDTTSKSYQILKRRVEVLYEDRMTALVLSLVCVFAVDYYVWDQVPHSYLYIWTIFQALVTVLRAGNVIWFKKTYKMKLNMQRWEYQDAFLTFLSGINWGLANFYFLPHLDNTASSFVLILTCGMVSGAVASSSSSKLTSLAFVIPTLSLFMVSCYFLEGIHFTVLGSLSAFYILIMFKTAKSFNKEIVRGIELALDNKSLLEEVTEKYELEVELKEEREKSVESSKMATLGQMAGGVAHEINNPLAIIKGKTSILKKLLIKEGLNSEKAMTQMEDISKTIDRIAKIIKGLLMFSRDGETDDFTFRNVQELLDEVLVLCSQKFKRIGIDFHVEIDPPDLEIFCQETQLSQVIFNLLNNSKDAIEENDEKWIRFSVQEQGNMITIRVTDSGAGIPLNIQEKILDPFFTTKAVGKGTGLGLSISKGIVEKHGGRFYINNDVKNTQFVIEIPKKAKEELAA